MPFWVQRPQFHICRIMISDSQTFCIPKSRFIQVLIREVRALQKQERSSQETIVQRQGKVPSPQRIYKQFLCVILQITPFLTRRRMVNFRLSTRFSEHGPVNSPPTNQKKIMHREALTKSLPIKASP